MRFIDESNDLGQHGVTHERRGAHEQGAVEHDGAGRHRVARCFANRKGLARHHGFVQRGVAFLNHGVERNRFPGPNFQQGVAGNRFHRCPHGAFVHDHPRFLGLQTHQAVNGVRCLEFRPCFEVVAQQHKGDDERCTVEEDMVGHADKLRQERQHRGEGHQRRPEHGHGGAEVNQHVHVGRSSSQGSPGVAMEISPRESVDR